jgi:hypothetical protein
LLWLGGVVFVSVCVGILKAFDIMESNYD